MVRKYVSEALEGITKALKGLEWYLNRYWNARRAPVAFREVG